MGRKVKRENIKYLSFCTKMIFNNCGPFNHILIKGHCESNGNLGTSFYCYTLTGLILYGNLYFLTSIFNVYIYHTRAQKCI